MIVSFNLWRAAAEHAFAQIRAGWDTLAPENADLPALTRLREEYATQFRYTVAFPEFIASCGKRPSPTIRG